MLSIIVAVAENNVIGKDNKLIWHLPEDLKRFKKLTLGHKIIMGRKTFESLEELLPNRKHIILTGNKTYSVDNEDVEVIHTIEELEKYINSPSECFVIGGAAIYTQLMPKVKKMYITKIHKNFEGDSYFPKINEKEWKLVEQKKGTQDANNPYDYEFMTYVRK